MAEELGLRKSKYGLRQDGTPKGNGWLGPIPMANGKDVMTEQSIGIEADGRNFDVPLLVPGLHNDDIEALRNGKKPSKQAYDRAIQHGLRRIQQGYSPYVD